MPNQKDKKIALTITANTAQLRRDMRRAGTEVKGFERQVTSLGNKLRNMRMRFQRTGIFGAGGGALRTAAGFAGAFGVQQMFQGAKEENAALTDIAITGNLTDKQLQKLRRTMFEVSNATSKSTSELTSFVSTVTTMTGDALGASDALAGIGEVMVATGASGEALAGTYVKLTTTMGLLPKQAKEAFNVLRSQEKLGSVTLTNIAAQFGKLTGVAGGFGAEGTGIKGVRTLGGLLQITQRGFAVGQEGEAANAAARFLGNLGRRSKKIKNIFGVNVFDKSGKARDLPTVFEELGVAFGQKSELFRTKGQLVFGEKGIRAAQQLRDAARVGFGNKLGSFASANQLLRTAGGEDVIGADAARRRRSASFQFDEQINILKNSFKKHLIPVFKTLASTMKDVGPDLVRVVKFLLENSRGLLKLWLGYKGVTFFKNLMAPIQGGGGGALTGMAGAVGGVGGGSFMGPGGELIRGGPARARYGNRHGIGTGTQWGTGGAMPGYYGPRWKAGPFGGQFGQDVRGFGVNPWQTDQAKLRAERSFRARTGRWFGRNRAMMGRGAMRGGSFAGQAAGMAGMMGMEHDYGPRGAGMAANMALMSGNPYLMTAGGAYKAQNEYLHYTTRKGKYGAREEMGGAMGTLAEAGQLMGGALGSYLRNEAKKVNLSAVIKDHMAKAAGMRNIAAVDKGIDQFYQGTWRGYEQKKNQEALIGEAGGTLTAGGVFGFSAQRQVELAKKGPKGLIALQSRMGSSRAGARAVAVREMLRNNPGMKITEEAIEKHSPQYAKLNDLYKALDRLILQLKKGMAVTVTSPDGMTPGQRVQNNSTPPGDFAPGGRYGA